MSYPALPERQAANITARAVPVTIDSAFRDVSKPTQASFYRWILVGLMVQTIAAVLVLAVYS